MKEELRPTTKRWTVREQVGLTSKAKAEKKNTQQTKKKRCNYRFLLMLQPFHLVQVAGSFFGVKDERLAKPNLTSGIVIVVCGSE